MLLLNDNVVIALTKGLNQYGNYASGNTKLFFGIARLYDYLVVTSTLARERPHHTRAQRA
jgi:hypothetical protein